MSVSLHNRRKLEDAMHRMLDGTTDAPDGKLTWKNVAILAGVSKATADRAVDLRTEFRRLLAEQQPDADATTRPTSARRARTDVVGELVFLRHENTELKHSTHVLQSVILTLVAENEQLRRRTRHQGNVILASTPSPSDPTR